MKDKKVFILGGILVLWIVLIFGVVFSMFLFGTSAPQRESQNMQNQTTKQSQEIKEEMERINTEKQLEEDRLAKAKALELIAEREKEEAQRKKALEENIKRNAFSTQASPKEEGQTSKISGAEAEPFIVHGEETIKGNVINLSTNEAIENVTVKLYDNAGLFLRSAETDKKGAFELASVYTKNVTLRAYKKGYVSGVYKSFTSDQLKTTLILKLDPGQKIRGKAVDKLTNEPIRLASVQLFKGISIIEGGITTNASGEFSVEGLPEGKLDLVIQKKGYSDSNTTLDIGNQPIENLMVTMDRAFQITIELRTPGAFVEVPKIRVYLDNAQTGLHYDRSILTNDKGKNIFRINGLSKIYSTIRLQATGYEFTENKNIAMKPGEETYVDFDLSEGLTVSGVVFDESQKPIGNLPVSVYEVFGGGRAAGEDVFKGQFLTDEKGVFKASGIKQGNVEFIVENTIYKRFTTRKVIRQDVSELVEINLEIESFFYGTLKSKAQKPPVANEVRFIPILSGGKIDGTRPMPKFSKTTETGFEISGVSPGLYRVTITAHGYKALIIEDYDVLPNQSSGVFELEDGHSIIGKVTVLGSPRQSISNAEIHFVTVIDGSNVKHRTKSDLQGFFLVEGLEVGNVYRCQADASGYQFKTFETTIDKDTKELLIELEAKKVFTGIVLDTVSKTPVSQFSVKIFGKIEAGLVANNSQTFNSSNGQFTIPVSNDMFSIEITAPNYGYLRVNDLLVTDPVRNYYLPKGAQLEITVLENQKPSATKTVIISETADPLPNTSWSYITNAEGKVLIPNLREGTYFLRVTATGKATINETIQVLSEMENKKEIHLIPGFTLAGRVLYKDTNFPVSSGLVWLDPEINSDRPIRTRLGKDGMFRIHNVAPGHHNIRINHGQMLKLDEYSEKLEKTIEVPNKVDNLGGVYTMETIYIEK